MLATVWLPGLHRRLRAAYRDLDCFTCNTTRIGLPDYAVDAIAAPREPVGYFPNDAAVPTARRREGSGSRYTPARRGPIAVS